MHSVLRIGLPLAAMMGSLLAATPTPASASTPDHVVQHDKGFVGPELYGIAAISPTDVWDVGVLVRPRHQPTQTLAEHWDGTEWATYPTSNPGAASNALYEIEALSSDDVWAIGEYQEVAQGQSHPLVLHWDGVSWAKSPFHEVGSSQTFVTSISALSPTDVWAVGNRYDSTRSSYTEHWNGERWRVVHSRMVSGADWTYLSDAIAISANDVWAVGYSHTSGRADNLAEHWNGTRWRIVPTADPDGTGGFLSTVYAAAADDVWAVGSNYEVPQHVVFQHWDGTQWSGVDAPTPGTTSFMQSMDGTSGTNIWAVGQQSGREHPHPLLIEHWDGTAWSDASVPGRPGGRFGVLTSVSTDAPDDAWATGYEDVPDSRGDRVRVTLRLHWDGDAWTEVPVT